MSADEIRGLVEREIDSAIDCIPEDMKMYRVPEIKAKFGFKDESDFLYGFMYARILFMTVCNVQNRIGRELLEEGEEYVLILSTIDKRLSQIRESISRAG